MATGKKKVIVYTDWISTFNPLTDEEAGRLIKHFFSYVNDLNPESDRLTELLFNPIKQTLKRDLEAWEKQQERNKENGQRGGRPKKPNETEQNQNNPVGFSETETNPKKGVSDSVSVSVSDIKRDKSLSEREQKQKFIDWFNSMKLKHCGSVGKFRTMSKADLNNLKELKKHYTVDEFETAFIAMSRNEWVITSQRLTIDHFLANKNFQKYVNTEVEDKPKFKAAWQ
jgi:hypothetical protein